MKKRGISLITTLFCLSLGLLSACAVQQPRVSQQLPGSDMRMQEPQQYFIRPGDQLDIKFFYNPELNETLAVRPDGKISLQLIDEVQAAGLRPSELDDQLTQEYGKELQKPVIAVIVRSFSGHRIFVGGEVNSQGIITMAGNMTPLQAVFDAGGFKETASPENAIIIRKGIGNKPHPIAINLKNAMEGKSDGNNYLLQADDILYVPKSSIAKVNKFVNQYIEKLLLFRGVSLGFVYELGDSDL